MIVMDRENLHAPGWSHVLSTSNDLEELERFRLQVGAPLRAFHIRGVRRPHLDLKLEPRDRALAAPGVRVFERTVELVRFLKTFESEPSRAASA
ncbi:MAG TPA: hypothetical protein VJN95_02795 [Gemmatimonadales bacterium]|nr:hypothetical protein [Gemmatimonadales bacterium]